MRSLFEADFLIAVAGCAASLPRDVQDDRQAGVVSLRPNRPPRQRQACNCAGGRAGRRDGGVFLCSRHSAALHDLALAVFAVVGVFCLFAYAVGLLQLSKHAGRNDVTKLLADTSDQGLLITEGDLQVIYANEAYMTLCGARDVGGILTVEQLFSGPPEVSDVIYRLVQAARAGQRQAEDLRLAPPLTGSAPAAWYRIKVRPLTHFGAKATLWAVADVTADRQRQENVFQELQHAIDFLDHAPAGFFSAAPGGDIPYMNKTLAGWLGYDLTRWVRAD